VLRHLAMLRVQSRQGVPHGGGRVEQGGGRRLCRRRGDGGS
jgi:hypothetical protein